ncbi:MAG: hypothetical protein C5B50_10080 [Verrucomicrobia bacterium]|nr:MAG: hypothetical protein C5B50_10080 [Verrucomicrobiota bacterium]
MRDELAGGASDHFSFLLGEGQSASGKGLALLAKRLVHLFSNPSAPLGKSLYDKFFAALGLVLLSPFFLLIASMIKLADGGSVFYRQKRIGQRGVPFFIWKFRTMVPDADQRGPAITGERDSRVTRVGRILRRTKLDELPQLWNVLKGEMSLVGPRPEVPRYVEHYTPDQREVLQHKPGITDLASLRFRNEESLLQKSEDAEAFYIQQCLPRKLQLNAQYARRANLLTDTWIILQTLCPYWMGVLGVYAIILAASFWVSYGLVKNSVLSQNSWREPGIQGLVTITLQLLCLLARRHYKGLLCYFGLPEARQIAIGMTQACLILLVLSPFAVRSLPPLNLTLVDLFVSLIVLGGFRVLLRLWRERSEGEQTPAAGAQRRVGIVGAGSVGAQFARWLTVQKNFGRTAVAFFDDDVGKWQKLIHEIPVVGMPECLLQGWSEKLDEVAVIGHGVSPARLEEITQLFQNTKLKVYTIQWPLPNCLDSEPQPLSDKL